MIELSKKDMMLPYGGLIIRLIHAYDIVIPPNEKVMKLDRFNVINVRKRDSTKRGGELMQR